jgi:hypothetical protein
MFRLRLKKRTLQTAQVQRQGVAGPFGWVIEVGVTVLNYKRNATWLLFFAVGTFLWKLCARR